MIVVSQTYILILLLLIFQITSARRRRKACDDSMNEVFSTCGNPCKQMTCQDRDSDVDFQPCNTECQPGCVCKQDYIREAKATDPCVMDC